MGLVHRFLGHGAASPFPNPAVESAPIAASYAHALYTNLWAFDGFNQAKYGAGEMRHPARDIPRAIHLSTGLVAALFFFAIVASFFVLESAAIARRNTVALDFGRAQL